MYNDDDDDIVEAEFAETNMSISGIDVGSLAKQLNINPDLLLVARPIETKTKHRYPPVHDTTPPPLREWDVYEYGDLGVEIVQNRATWKQGKVKTLIIENGRSWSSTAIDADFIGRRLVGITPFGATGPDCVTFLTSYTRRVRETFNTENIAGIGGNNVFVYMRDDYDLWKLHKNMPVMMMVKRVFSPLVEEIIEPNYDTDREFVLSIDIWNQFDARIPRKARRRTMK